MTEDVVIVIIVFFVVIVYAIKIFNPENKEDKKDKSDKKNKESEEDGLKNYDFIDYLGGHPLSDNAKVKYGALYIFDEKIYFNSLDQHILKDNEIKKEFEIELKDINDCSIETKESLTAGRMLLTGILAFALKKKKRYVTITFNHPLGETTVVFSSRKNKSVEIVKNINTKRLKLIEKKQKNAEQVK